MAHARNVRLIGSSASPQPAADPSFSTEHAHDGSFACPYYEAVLVDRGVTAKVHLYTVKDLAKVLALAEVSPPRLAPLKRAGVPKNDSGAIAK